MDDLPAGCPQLVQALSVLGELPVLRVPQAVVLDCQLVLGPREVHPRDKAASVPDVVLRDGHGQGAAPDQQAETGLLG
jgi:hypothetical protein